MGFHLGVVSEGSIESTLELGAKERWSEGEAEKILGGLPESLDDGDRSGFADGAKPLSDALDTKPTTKNSGGEL